MFLDFLIGLLLSLLPARVRQQRLAQWNGNLRSCAIVSGFVQCIGLLGLLAARYFYFMNYRLGTINEAIIKKGAATAVGNESVQFGMGFVSLVEFLLHPISIILIYFVFEGLVRVIAAFVSGEVVGSLPFLVLDKVVTTVQNRRDEKRQGDLIPDIVTVPPVTGSGYDLSIASCRAKPDWNQLVTISYNETLYEVADYLEAAPPRHVYLLRRAPVHKVVRGLHNYDPEEVMKT